MDATFEDPVCGLANIRLGRAVLQDARVNRVNRVFHASLWVMTVDGPSCVSLIGYLFVLVVRWNELSSVQPEPVHPKNLEHFCNNRHFLARLDFCWEGVLLLGREEFRSFTSFRSEAKTTDHLQ